MLMNQQHRVAALLIQRYNVPMPFAAEMAVRGFGRAEQLLAFSPALNQACEAKDAAMINVEMARFMTVVMRRVAPLDAATLAGLCQAGMLLPNARTKELEEAHPQRPRRRSYAKSSRSGSKWKLGSFHVISYLNTATKLA